MCNLHMICRMKTKIHHTCNRPLNVWKSFLLNNQTSSTSKRKKNKHLNCNFSLWFDAHLPSDSVAWDLELSQLFELFFRWFTIFSDIFFSSEYSYFFFLSNVPLVILDCIRKLVITIVRKFFSYRMLGH